MQTSSTNYSGPFISPFPLNIMDRLIEEVTAPLNKPAKPPTPIETGIGRDNATILAAREHIEEHSGEFNPSVLNNLGIELDTTHTEKSNTPKRQLNAAELTKYHTWVTNRANYPKDADKAALRQEITYNLNPLFILAKEGDSHAAKLLLTSVIGAKESRDKEFSKLIRGVAGHMLMELAKTKIQDKEEGQERSGLQMLLDIIDHQGVGKKNRSFNPLQLLGGLNPATTNGQVH